jgi:ASCH domain-containing protein
MNPQQREWETRRITHALSIRQPWAELILRGVKVCEFRHAPTQKRERVYIYAAQGASRPEDYLEYGLEREDLPTGLLVGTVDVVDCFQLYREDDPKERGPLYAYKFANPRRLTKPLPSKNHAQPSWFAHSPI